MLKRFTPSLPQLVANKNLYKIRRHWVLLPENVKWWIWNT